MIGLCREEASEGCWLFLWQGRLAALWCFCLCNWFPALFYKEQDYEHPQFLCFSYPTVLVAKQCCWVVREHVGMVVCQLNLLCETDNGRVASCRQCNGTKIKFEPIICVSRVKRANKWKYVNTCSGEQLQCRHALVACVCFPCLFF